jgi:hypothetical protein
MMGLGAILAVQGSFGSRAPICQSDSYKSPDRHRMNDLFAVGECFQGLEFFVRKPDLKPSSLHDNCS